MDRFSDITLFIGLIYLYAHLDRPDYVVITALAMMFSVMTSYTRARAESLIEKCKVGFMERPERIVLFMIGAFTNRMAARPVGDSRAVDRDRGRSHLLHVARAEPRAEDRGRAPRAAEDRHRGVKRTVTLPALFLWRAFFWTYERATWQYDLWVIAILALRLADPAGLAARPDGAGPRPHRVAPRARRVEKAVRRDFRFPSDVLALVVRTEVQARPRNLIACSAILSRSTRRAAP